MESSSNPIIMYSRPGCPMQPPVEAALKKAGAEYIYINIWKDNEGRAAVRAINNGNESVPTLQFPDGSTLTEPGARALYGRLADLGYEVDEAVLTRSFGLGRMRAFAQFLLLFGVGYGLIVLLQWVVGLLR